MWSLPWSPWGPWSSQEKEPEEVKKQTKAGRGQRSQRGVEYYQRRSEEKSATSGETAVMASGNQQEGDRDDGWQVVQEEEPQVISTCKCRSRKVPFWDAASQMYLCQCVFREP